jgi:hypothetical protein
MTESEDNYFYTVILFYFGVTPASSICTDHISTMPDRIKVKAIVLISHQIFVAHAHRYPIGRRFLDSEAKLLDS